jgi:ribonucleoside-diphosphate reductase alpha chain
MTTIMTLTDTIGAIPITLSPQAEVVAKKRYFLKDASNEVVEDAPAMFRRVADAIAIVEKKYGKLDIDAQLTSNEFYTIMSNLDFIPNSPTLMNAGTKQGTLSACFVLPLEDSMEGIMKAAHDTAMVQKFGGGTGFALSNLRPKGDRIKTTHGISCGPIEVLKTLSRVSSMITQGGKRDGANMAVMDIHHPDILEFIGCKSIEGDIHNFNISVGVTNDFMKAVQVGSNYPLINPRNNEIVGELDAREVFSKIVYGAWRNGEPGMIFLDTVNRDNHVIEQYGRMIATNPCGEQPLLGNESCNLGSINVVNFFKPPASETPLSWKEKVDWSELGKVVKIATRFLDNVIDANYYATPEIETMTKATRKIGLGVMGFADLLIQLRIGYDTEQGRQVGGTLMGFIQDVADNASRALAKERGVFPAWHNSDYKVLDKLLAVTDASTKEKFRNACRLTVAPTGTISMLADTSSGVEPTFALAWRKMNILEGETLYYINKYFETDAKLYDFYSDELMDYISNGGSIKTRPDVPEWVKEVYVTAEDISPEAHVKMQAAFQESCDSGISKTINFANDATIEDVYTAYMTAWENGCKGITVYRSGSREKEVLVRADSPKQSVLNGFAVDYASLQIENTEACCDNAYLVEEGGCVTCKSCGWSKCHIA